MAQIERTPILVNNPYKNKLMNVEPLFDLIRIYALDEGRRAADNGIKIAALTTESEWIDEYERKNVISFLYRVRELFSQMEECQITTSKSKEIRDYDER